MNRVAKCVLSMGERERTTPALLERLGEIKKMLYRGTGAIDKIAKTKMTRSQNYHAATIEGWCEHFRILANELIVIQCEMAKRLSE